MADRDCHELPERAHRPALEELVDEASALEAQLIKHRAATAELEKQILSVQQRLHQLQERQSGPVAELERSSAIARGSAVRILFDREPTVDELAPDGGMAIELNEHIRSLISNNDVGMVRPSIREALLDKLILEPLHLVDQRTRAEIFHHWDPVRRYTIAAALDRINRDKIPGHMAELGVYQGDSAVFYNQLCPERTLYLFDTFEGFPSDDVEYEGDDRFRNTSLDLVKSKFADLSNVRFRQGYFPETVAGLENEVFSFVMLDADLYNPTVAGLEFFYERMSPGGYIFIHDYTSYESNRAVSRAVDLFMKDKAEKIIDLPDRWGSVVFRKS